MNTNPNAKTIVCYGDSNTWGDMPNVDGRHPADVRWVGVLQNMLGSDYEVVNEGLCGRTFIAVEKEKPHRCGITHLKSILETNSPIDIIIVMLGTNDLKNTFNLEAKEIAEHLRETIHRIQEENIPSILIICPPPVENPRNCALDERLKGAPKKSRLLASLYKEVVEELSCLFLNSGDFISLENTDGYHLNAEHHRILGERISEIIKR